MQIAFEFTAAVPKRLRAAEEQPAQQSMRGDRKITQAPSTDQKRVRREMSRKTAEVEVEAKIYAEESRTACPDCGAKERKQKWTGYGSDYRGPVYGWECASCGHHYSAPKVQRTASAGQVEEHDDVQAKDEFNSEHVEPGGGRHHHHHPRTAMDYTALMNDVGDCRSCGGNLVKQPTEKGASTVTAKCEDCGMEHQLQDNSRVTAALRPAANARLRAVQAIREIEQSVCPDCGSQGWGSKEGNGHSQGTGGPRGSYWDWHVRCRDCGHHFTVPRAKSVDHFGSLTWEPVTSRYLPDPHQHMSAIARRAQSVLDTKEIQ